MTLGDLALNTPIYPIFHTLHHLEAIPEQGVVRVMCLVLNLGGLVILHIIIVHK